MTLLEEIKAVLLANIADAPFGIYNDYQPIGDDAYRLFKRGGVIVNIHYAYEYFEVLGLSDDAFDEIKKYYDKIRKPILVLRYEIGEEAFLTKANAEKEVERRKNR